MIRLILHLSIILLLLVVLPYQTISFFIPQKNVKTNHCVKQHNHNYYPLNKITNQIRPPLKSFSSTNDNESTSSSTTALNSNILSIDEATNILKTYDQSLNDYIQKDGSQGMGGGISATKYWKEELSDYEQLRQALVSLSNIAYKERSMNTDEGYGRTMLGICAASIQDAIGALKGYVPNLNIPRGLLHGMDVDGQPIEIKGSVYIKYSTGGVMTFSQMRKTGMGLDALWKPGDAIVEMYDGDFEGVYVQMELSDGDFRQFGVLPLDLFDGD